MINYKTGSYMMTNKHFCKPSKPRLHKFYN